MTRPMRGRRDRSVRRAPARTRPAGRPRGRRRRGRSAAGPAGPRTAGPDRGGPAGRGRGAGHRPCGAQPAGQGAARLGRARAERRHPPGGRRPAGARPGPRFRPGGPGRDRGHHAADGGRAGRRTGPAAGRGPSRAGRRVRATLAADLDGLLARTRAAGTTVTAHQDPGPAGDWSWLPAITSREAYRIVQEGLSNALRHGTAPLELRVSVQGGKPAGSMTPSGVTPGRTVTDARTATAGKALETAKALETGKAVETVEPVYWRSS